MVGECIMKKIGIMGGTFNPIHNAHLVLGECSYEQFDLDKVWFMPSKNPPHKLNKNIASQKHRSNMIIKAIEDNPHFEFYKKNRIEVDIYTTVSQLKYARGWTGRLFSAAINFAIKLLRAIGKKSAANVLIMGVFYNPLRAISRLSGGLISWGQLQGMIVMFNGKFFKGLSMFLKEGRKKKKERKLQKKRTKN